MVWMVPVIIIRFILRTLFKGYKAIAAPLHLPVPTENTMARRQARQSSNWAGFGAGEKAPLTGSMQKTIRQHIVEANQKDALTGYTYERRPSQYPTASSDLVIYDGNGRAVMQGREFAGGRMSFWTA